MGDFEMSGPNWKLEEDGETITISFPTSPRVAIEWKTATVDDHLQKLGELRTQMKPEISRTFPFGQLVKTIPDPIFRTEPDAMTGDTLLHIRDPRFGWLHYLIPKQEARKLVTAIQNQVDATAPRRDTAH
jgi:hypothetical protein